MPSSPGRRLLEHFSSPRTWLTGVTVPTRPMARLGPPALETCSSASCGKRTVKLRETGPQGPVSFFVPHFVVHFIEHLVADFSFVRESCSLFLLQSDSVFGVDDIARFGCTPRMVFKP